MTLRTASHRPRAALRLMLLSLALILWAGAAEAATYYVSQSGGADTNAGTIGAPWQTIAKVQGFQGALTADDQVLFKRGDTWLEELTITNLQGTAGHPVVIGAYGAGALPIIDGGSTRATCINAVSGVGKYITIDSCEDSTASMTHTLLDSRRMASLNRSSKLGENTAQNRRAIVRLTLQGRSYRSVTTDSISGPALPR